MNKNGYSTSVQIKFNNEKEAEILDKINRQPNKNAYIKLLIYKDIEEAKNKNRNKIEEIIEIVKECNEDQNLSESEYKRAFERIAEIIK